MAKRPTSSGVKIVARPGRTSEAWVIRRADGRLETVAVSKSSADAMDKIVKRYAGTMKRLAKR